jgi:hypothetical protein
MKGSWIIKEVYFEDGFPKIIRDLKPETPYVTPEVTPDDRGSTGEVPGKLEIPEREESAGKPTNGKAQLPNGKPMTREDIIRMAREAGIICTPNTGTMLERFAALVAEHMTKEKSEPVGKFAKFTDGVWREVTDGSPGVFLYQREEK